MGNRRHFIDWLIVAAVLACAALLAPPLRAQTCEQCHQPIAAIQSKSAMALTWRAMRAAPFNGTYTRDKAEGPLRYHVAPAGPDQPLTFTVQAPGRAAISMPVEAVVGGERHGISFLARLSELGGSRLARPVLIETRYLHSSHTGGLLLSPGFPVEEPSDLEATLGRVLSPSFEKKCLTCHGSPAFMPGGKAGVGCENCHGPVAPHLQALRDNAPSLNMRNPGKLSPEQQIEVCAQCHSGFTPASDPLPDDLLVSNQVTALKNSECYIQSGKGFSCISCHDAHKSATPDDARYAATCLACHGPAAGRTGATHGAASKQVVARHVTPVRAAQCPVSPASGCIRCHMPVKPQGSFALVDHWIRVQTAPGASSGAGSAAAKARRAAPPRARQAPPKRVFLRMVLMQDRAKAQAVAEQLRAGQPFFDLARENSVDASAVTGGFLGAVWLDQTEPSLARAAAALAYGDTSPVIETRGAFAIVQRMPRDFRWRAGALAADADRLRIRGDFDGAIARYRDALKINPHLLRALIFLGVSFGQKGNQQGAIAALEQAVDLFPQDASAIYNLGVAYGAAGRADDEMNTYRRAIAIDPDLLPAYLNLGAALLSSGELYQASRIFEQGLQINPLSALLQYNLGMVRRQQGRAEEAAKALDLASKIDPRIQAAH